MFKARRDSAARVSQRQPKHKRKKCFTYVAVICSDPEAQSLLPQFLLGNFNTFLKRDLATLAKECGANLVLVRFGVVCVRGLLFIV